MLCGLIVATASAAAIVGNTLKWLSYIFRVKKKKRKNLWKMFWNKNVYNKYIASRNFKLMLLRVHYVMCALFPIHNAYEMPATYTCWHAMRTRDKDKKWHIIRTFEQITIRKPYSKYIKLIVSKWQCRRLSDDDDDNNPMMVAAIQWRWKIERKTPKRQIEMWREKKSVRTRSA